MSRLIIFLICVECCVCETAKTEDESVDEIKPLFVHSKSITILSVKIFSDGSSSMTDATACIGWPNKNDGSNVF